MRHSFLPLAACLAALALPAVATAASRVTLTAERVDYEGMQLEGLEVRWRQRAAASGELGVRAGRVAGVGATGPLSRLAIDCARLEVRGDELRCSGGRLRGALGTLGMQDTGFSASTAADGSLRLRLQSFAIAGGRGRVEVTERRGRWELDADLAALDLDALATLARPWFTLPEGFTVAGSAAGTLQASGRDDDLSTATAAFDVARLDFADAEGTLAGEGVAGRLDVTLRAATGGAFGAEGRISLSGGQAYSDPVFLDFGRHGLDLDFRGLLAADGSRFDAESFRLLHHDVADVAGSALLDLAGETLLLRAKTRLAVVELATAVPAYAQPYLISTAFKDLEGAGRLRGEIDIDDGLPVRVDLQLEDVALDSQTGSLFIAGLAGNFNWHDDLLRDELAKSGADSEIFKSRLAWREARLWNIDIAAVELPFTTTGRHFRLLDPVLLPVFDGGLAVETLRVRHAGTDDMYLRFDAELQPISVARITRALGWPEFSGRLSGRIPQLEWQAGEVTLGGNLEAQVFDGRIVVRELRLRDPLGRFPRLYASIDIDNLDLEQLTNTFSFGMITGRLSGYVRGLETFNWMPEAFDARLATPPGDRSPHRISQRAVANLSRVGGGGGGGVVAALQGGFLRFFENFRYDRLGLTCRLENDVCSMGGVEPQDGGYYIVKGKGIPRIDVIGNQQRVAWRRLVGQLASIMEGSGPEIR